MELKMKNQKATSLILLCCLLLTFGCSTTRNTDYNPVFYPPAPDQPKLQFLTSFSSPSDLTPPPSALQKFIGVNENKPEPGIIKPYGMTVEGSKLYVCDTIGGQVHILDFEKRSWEYLREKKIGKPFNIAVDLSGSRYIADPINKVVQIYSSSGVSLGPLDNENFTKPTGIAVSADRIYVGDIAAHQVYVFEKTSRRFLFSIPRQPDNDQEKLYAPANIALDQQGNIYVSDLGAFWIQKYDVNGNYLRTFGGHGKEPGTFARNKGIAVDHSGNLYAVDAAFQNTQIFNDEGELLLFFGEPGGSAVPMALPADVCIDYENTALFQSYADPDFKLEYLVFVSNQLGPRKVSVYGFGQMVRP